MIREIYEQMTEGDKNYIVENTDFDAMKAEIDENVQRLLDTINYMPDIEHVAIIDTTMNSILDTISEAVHLIEG